MAKDTFFKSTKSITLCGVEYNLDQPRIMGILNLTPDSFYDGGKYKNETEILEKVKQMLDEGAWMIDIGGCSTRPEGELITEEEEIKRVIPVIELLIKNFKNILLSIDTFRPNVAKKALELGVCMINDISGGRWYPEMFSIVKKYHAGYILMHSRGEFKKMHQSYQYDHLVLEIKNEIKNQIEKAEKENFYNIIIDPGFGFSKDVAQNFELLNGLNEFTNLGYPILCGISRKSFIWKALGTDAKNALNGTSALHLNCLEKGANFLRVHDVKEAKEIVNLYLKLKTYGKER